MKESLIICEKIGNWLYDINLYLTFKDVTNIPVLVSYNWKHNFQ